MSFFGELQWCHNGLGRSPSLALQKSPSCFSPWDRYLLLRCGNASSMAIRSCSTSMFIPCLLLSLMKLRRLSSLAAISQARSAVVSISSPAPSKFYIASFHMRFSLLKQLYFPKPRNCCSNRDGLSVTLLTIWGRFFLHPQATCNSYCSCMFSLCGWEVSWGYQEIFCTKGHGGLEIPLKVHRFWSCWPERFHGAMRKAVVQRTWRFRDTCEGAT